MPSFIKNPLANSLHSFVDSKIETANQLSGRSWPCSITAVGNGSVTVSFQVAGDGLTLPSVTMPVAQSNWIRHPVQVGDTGLAIPSDVYLGGVSGLGGGTANFTQQSNLSNLTFHPIANVNQTASPNANAALVQGPQGVVLQDSGNHNSLTLSPSSTVFTVGGTTLTFNASGLTLSVGGNTITMNASGITLSSGDVVAGTVTLVTHLHGGVQTGTGFTGLPVG